MTDTSTVRRRCRSCGGPLDRDVATGQGSCPSAGCPLADRLQGPLHAAQHTTTLTVADSPKMLRETFAVAQTLIGQHTHDRRAEHIARLSRLVVECERHRPTGSDGSHDDRHTPTCGCDWNTPATGG